MEKPTKTSSITSAKAGYLPKPKHPQKPHIPSKLRPLLPKPQTARDTPRSLGLYQPPRANDTGKNWKLNQPVKLKRQLVTGSELPRRRKNRQQKSTLAKGLKTVNYKGVADASRSSAR